MPRREIMRIAQRNKRSVQTRIQLLDLSPLVLDQCVSRSAVVAAAVKASRVETIAAAAPPQRKTLPAVLSEQGRKVYDDQGSRGTDGRRSATAALLRPKPLYVGWSRM
jgi:hypothetical protein